MKIHIVTQLTKNPWGGGNQFLSALKNYFEKNSLYASHAENADVILANSYQDIPTFFSLRKKFPEKVFLYRLGPVFSYHRSKQWKFVDKLMTSVARDLSDGVIFQSLWSQREFQKIGLEAKHTAVILNAPDPNVFSPKLTGKHEPLRLLATSWSQNKNKGFDFYAFLDKFLENKKYEMNFIGNSPISFQKIQYLGTMTKTQIAEELQKSDIFVAPFAYEACSNAILEALACAVPVVALESGANSEIVRAGGELFRTPEEMVEKIEKIAANYEMYREKIQRENMDEIAAKYVDFAKHIANQKQIHPLTLSQKIQYFFQIQKLRLIR